MTCRQLLIKDKLLMLNVYPLRRDRVTNHKFLVSWQAGRQGRQSPTGSSSRVAEPFAGRFSEYYNAKFFHLLFA